MVEGESGILAISPPWDKPLYEPSKRRLTWSDGAIATLYSADEPNRLRGPQHGAAWCDELCAWRYPETWDMLQFGLRLGAHPQTLVSTTPKPTKQLREIMSDKSTVITRGSTYDNQENLPAPFLERIIERYHGSRLGRQELNAEILDDTLGALWNRKILDLTRTSKYPPLYRIVVAIDPSTTANSGSDEAGIIVAGISEKGHYYILEDLSLVGSPSDWARVAIDAYDAWGADRIIAESNNGGDMVMETIHRYDYRAAVELVWASRGKYVRAEPVSILYEQGKVHHVGAFGALEDELTTWVPGEKSPNRLDALVWAVTNLSGGGIGVKV